MIGTLDLDSLTATGIWTRLDPDTRLTAARALYAHDWGEAKARREADAAIATTLRFREEAVRRLPVEKRVVYLSRAVRPDESLAHSLLLALHLENRRSMLASFLDALDLPHKDGVIDEPYELSPPEKPLLAQAAARLFESHPAAEVEIYLATLCAMDPEIWGSLRDVLEERRTQGQR